MFLIVCWLQKSAFINEMSNICDSVGADVELVRQGAGADKRIGMSFFHPGVGYGGSCFPKRRSSIDKNVRK